MGLDVRLTILVIKYEIILINGFLLFNLHWKHPCIV